MFHLTGHSVSSLNWEDEGGAAWNSDGFLPKIWCHGVGAIPLNVKDIHEIVPKPQIIQVVNFMQP